MTSFSTIALRFATGLAVLTAAPAVFASPAIIPPMPPTIPGVTVASASPVIIRPLPPTIPDATMAASPVIIRPLPPTIPDLV